MEILTSHGSSKHKCKSLKIVQLHNIVAQFKKKQLVKGQQKVLSEMHHTDRSPHFHCLPIHFGFLFQDDTYLFDLVLKLFPAMVDLG